MTKNNEKLITQRFLQPLEEQLRLLDQRETERNEGETSKITDPYFSLQLKLQTLFRSEEELSGEDSKDQQDEVEATSDDDMAIVDFKKSSKESRETAEESPINQDLSLMKSTEELALKTIKTDNAEIRNTLAKIIKEIAQTPREHSFKFLLAHDYELREQGQEMPLLYQNSAVATSPVLGNDNKQIEEAPETEQSGDQPASNAVQGLLLTKDETSLLHCTTKEIKRDDHENEDKNPGTIINSNATANIRKDSTSSGASSSCSTDVDRPSRKQKDPLQRRRLSHQLKRKVPSAGTRDFVVLVKMTRKHPSITTIQKGRCRTTRNESKNDFAD